MPRSTEYLNHFLSREQGEEGYSNAHPVELHFRPSSFRFRLTFEKRVPPSPERELAAKLTVLCRDNWSVECKKGGKKKKRERKGRRNLASERGSSPYRWSIVHQPEKPAAKFASPSR